MKKISSLSRCHVFRESEAAQAAHAGWSDIHVKFLINYCKLRNYRGEYKSVLYFLFLSVLVYSPMRHFLLLKLRSFFIPFEVIHKVRSLQFIRSKAHFVHHAIVCGLIGEFALLLWKEIMR